MCNLIASKKYNSAKHVQFCQPTAIVQIPINQPWYPKKSAYKKIIKNICTIYTHKVCTEGPIITI